MDKPHIKKIAVEQLRPGMYVHDLNVSWMDHPYLSHRMLVKDEATVTEIAGLGVRELYIDTDRGADVPDAPTREAVQTELDQHLADLASEGGSATARASLAQEIARAGQMHQEANRIVRDMLADIRLGKQIEMEKIEPMVERMVDSIFRCQDALLPLASLKQHDSYTFQHSVSVCALMITFARGLHLPREAIREAALGALLHDVGKARVPEAILNKPAKLTEAEFARMKSHVVQGLVLLQHTPGVSQIAQDVAGQHHERFDGTGYPNALLGEAVSLYGRMAAIVDVYDAISSDRVYHKGMPPPAAMGRMLEWSKYHFDPELVRTFIKSVGIYPTGSLVHLESGRLAVVREQHADRLMQPLVRVIYHAVKDHYLPPEDLDLARPGCQDRIVGHESFEHWGIERERWLPA
jgi:cyclic di-GMP phosphodiesterase